MTDRHGDFIWYELIVKDVSAVQPFYGELLGWTFKDSGHPEMEYHVFSADGPEVGGLMALTEDMEKNGAQPLWAGYVHVDDVDATADMAKKAGGQILMPPQDIPNVGRIAFITDPQGAPLYIMRSSSADAGQQSESFAHSQPRNGHCAWNELFTSDLESAKSFYKDIFGWVQAESMDMGPMGEYAMFKNGEDSEFMTGGMMKKPAEMPVSLWGYYFRVPSIDKALAYIKENGGQIINGPMEIPGGEFALNAVDPQGAAFALVGKQ
ncbi:MAG: VOC family protein [Pseudomonadota bacterium]